MALPEGIETCTVTSGVPVTFGGAPVKAFVSVEPSVYLVHTATGTPLVDFLEELSVTEGVAAQFTLPVDQDGFQDENGNAYRGWFYTARITYSTTSKAKNKTPKVKVFQLVSGQTLVDLDTLPGGVAALPYTAPLAAVTSVNGQTGAVLVDAEPLPARLEEAALNATFALKYPIDARAEYGVGETKTPAQNYTALAQAIAAAISEGRDLIIACPKDETVDIAGTLEIPPGANIKILGSKERTTIRGTVVGQPVFRVRGKATIEGFTLTTTAGRSVASLSEVTMFRGEIQTAQHSGIVMEYNASGSVFRNIHGYGMHSVIVTSGWDAALNAVSANLSQGILMEDISGEDVAFVILSRGVQDATYRRIKGTYSLTPGTAAPPHIIYMSEDQTTPARYSENVNISDIAAWDGTTGAPVKFAAVKGGSISNVNARNCRGIFDIMNVSDVVIDNFVSTEDNASAVDPGPVKASVEMLTCNRTTVSNGRISGKAIDYYKAIWLRDGTDNVLRNVDCVTRHTVTSTHESISDVDIYGTNVVVENVSVNNLGNDRGSGFRIRLAPNAKIINPKVSGNFKFGIYGDTGCTGAVIDADQNKLQVKAALVGAPFFILTGQGPNFTFRTPAAPVTELDQPIAWHGRAKTNNLNATLVHLDSGHVLSKLSGTWEWPADGVRNVSNGFTDSAVVETGAANVEIVSRIKTGASGSSAPGLVFRAIDNNDYLLVAIIGTGTVRILSREAGGATATLAQTPFVSTVGRCYDLKVIAHVDKVEVYVDGVLKLEHTLSGALQTKFGAATKHGFFAQSSGDVRWKTFKVRPTS